MSADNIIPYDRLYRIGYQSTGRGNKPIDHYRFSLGCSTENQTGDAADLISAYLGEYIETVFGIRFIYLEYLFDNRNFLFSWLSSSPVPLPVNSATGLPVITAAMAVLGVVLPIPISPVPNISYDLTQFSGDFDSRLHCFSRVGDTHCRPGSMLFVPGAIFRR